jgi:hypothetical protein
VPDKGWKQYERRMARDVGTERIPVTGERHGADARDDRFAYQFKLGRGCPAYLRDWLDGIRKAGAKLGLTGVVVWKPKGTHDEGALVLMRWDDWVRLINPGTIEAENEPREGTPRRPWTVSDGQEP